MERKIVLRDGSNVFWGKLTKKADKKRNGKGDSSQDAQKKWEIAARKTWEGETEKRAAEGIDRMEQQQWERFKKERRVSINAESPCRDKYACNTSINR